MEWKTADLPGTDSRLLPLPQEPFALASDHWLHILNATELLDAHPESLDETFDF